jgi:hypothetical protein
MPSPDGVNNLKMIIDLRPRIGNGVGVRGNRLESHGKVVSPLKDAGNDRP